MWRLIKWIMVLAVIGILAVIGYAVLGDLSAPQTLNKKQVTIEIN